jgi:hypothetical protein
MISTPARESYYLGGLSDSYPTAYLDLDGNERASVYLRNGDLNLFHLLWQQLARPDLSEGLRKAAQKAFGEILNRNRKDWQKLTDDLKQELEAVRERIAAFHRELPARDRKWTRVEKEKGLDEAALRQKSNLEHWRLQEREYAAVAGVYSRWLDLHTETLSPQSLKLEDYIPPRFLGTHNAPYQLRHYPVGIKSGGLKLNLAGELDFDQTFEEVDYFELFVNLTVRNNPQAGIDTHPVDWVACRIPPGSLAEEENGNSREDRLPIWLYAGSQRQALILANSEGGRTIEYVPLNTLRWTEGGKAIIEKGEWQNGYPLKIWEDPELRLPAGEPRSWLNREHSEEDWFRVLAKTQYSNGLIGLVEQMSPPRSASYEPSPEANPANSEKLIQRFLARVRSDLDADFAVFAGDHWNFNAFSFNPGGNHGAFFQMSSHAVLMFSGGRLTDIPRGLSIQEPYDSLTLVPTLLTLTGHVHDGKPDPSLVEKGFRPFPGKAIRELTSTNSSGPAVKRRQGN